MSEVRQLASRSDAIFADSLRCFPGGVNSPVRAFSAVGGRPVVVTIGRGAFVTDADGRTFIDFIGSWGALILGHAPDEVVQAVTNAAAGGTSFGLPTPQEAELARLIQRAFPSMELLRLVNSGTEAAMSAVRAARGFTGRTLIVKFEGCYHGHADALLAKGGSGIATLGVPGSAGVPAGAVADTLVLPYNNLDAVEDAFAAHDARIAAVIVEPVAANMGVVRPVPGFLEGLRAITRRHEALLIFDEVITGFRLGAGGVQAMTGISPDLTCLGKIVGGGLPLGTYGGRREVMEQLAPLGPVYQAGTLAGNPVAVAAGIATLRKLGDPGFYPVLDQRSAALAKGLATAAAEAGAKVSVVREGSMLTVFFTEEPPVNFGDVAASDRGRFARFFHALLDRGVLIPPSPFEAWFVSGAHTQREIERALEAAHEAFRVAV